MGIVSYLRLPKGYCRFMTIIKAKKQRPGSLVRALNQMASMYFRDGEEFCRRPIVAVLLPPRNIN